MELPVFRWLVVHVIIVARRPIIIEITLNNVNTIAMAIRNYVNNHSDSVSTDIHFTFIHSEVGNYIRRKERQIFEMARLPLLPGYSFGDPTVSLHTYTYIGSWWNLFREGIM